MDSKQGSGANAGVAANRIYEDFEPHLEWAKDETFDTLLVYLPGFLKDKLKIQITSSGKLRISGERPTGQHKWRRFLKEFPLAPDCDTNKISAKFEGGILYVKVPKPQNTTNPNPNPNPKVPPTSATKDQTQNQEKPKPKPKPTTLADEKRATPTPGDQSDQKPPQKQQEQAPPKPAVLSPPQKQQSKAGARKDALAELASSSGKAENAATSATCTKLGEPIKPGPGGETNVGVIKRTTSLFSEYKKAIATRGSPRMLVNMLLAVLFVGVLALYAKNILIRSIGKSNGSEHSHHDHEL